MTEQEFIDSDKTTYIKECLDAALTYFGITTLDINEIHALARERAGLSVAEKDMDSSNMDYIDNLSDATLRAKYNGLITNMQTLSSLDNDKKWG